MIDLQVAIHIFVAVLVLGTVWRLTTYHLVASPNQTLAHLGTAMATQY